LAETLSDTSEEVVRQDLEVMAKISANPVYFDKLMNSLIGLFCTDSQLLENRGTMIIRQLSLFMNPERVFRALAQIIETQEDLEFASVMIQTLNIILLTSPEFYQLRINLKNLPHSEENKNLFVTLYKSWCHNPAATLCLCLLAQQYSHSTSLVFKFSELEVTVNFLVEIDKLVQLLESPIFTTLRLQLLEPENYPFLFKALYGLLMLLPQSSAFETLKNRLNTISSLGVLQLIPKNKQNTKEAQAINSIELLDHFCKVQELHSKKALTLKSQLLGPR